VFVQPSGLIFLVIIAIWATYLLQHWVRRREHLATARSVDRFSDAMRVLERRVPLPEFDMSTPRPRSYTVSPARPSRPEVVVKRLQSPAPQTARRPAATVRPTRTVRTRPGMAARRLRGLSFLASLSLVVVVSTMAGFSLLRWWSVPAAVGVVMADFAWLRHVAAAQRDTRRATVSMRRAEAALRRTAVPAGSNVPRSRPAAARTSSHSGPVTVAPVAGVAEVAEPAGSAAEADPSGWSPVPVPPPTYTLKAKAERPEALPTVVNDPAPARVSSFDGVIDEGELDGLLDRRAAGA
jgi:hypothetical protein